MTRKTITCPPDIETADGRKGRSGRKPLCVCGHSHKNHWNFSTQKYDGCQMISCECVSYVGRVLTDAERKRKQRNGDPSLDKPPRNYRRKQEGT